MKHASKTLPAIVYLVINKINGKRYIGVTTKPLRRRMVEHFSHAQKRHGNGAFYRAIRKYGRDAFEFSILAYCATGTEGLQREMSLIAELQPEYNSTAGGDGNIGREMSLEGRRRISEAKKGKKYHQGHLHSEETKRILREASLRPENMAAWRDWSKLGPASMMRAVVCLDDGKIFESASAAAREYDVAKSAVIELCLGRRGRKSIGGRRFAYEEAA